MLLNANAWIANTFDLPRPDMRTVKKWYTRGRIRGQIIEGRLYVETVDTFLGDKHTQQDLIPPEHKLDL